MKTKLAAIVTALAVAGAPAGAHRLDEYLQAAIVSVAKDKVTVEMMLTPGVAVASAVLAKIDTNRDGIVSEAEERSYAASVLADLSLKLDGHPLQPRLTSLQFPGIGEMRKGQGEIEIHFEAVLPPGGAARKLTFENHHESKIAAYQVNCLVPGDRDLRIVAQNRDYLQSRYELDYAQDGVAGSSWPVPVRWIGTGALVALGWLALACATHKRSCGTREAIQSSAQIR